MKMKAITVWQPWATLIMVGAKPWEFRNSPYREYIGGPREAGTRIVIQAGARPVRPAEVEDLLRRIDSESAQERTGLIAEIARDVLLKVKATHKRRLLPLGMALGTVVLGEPVLSCDLFKLNVADSDRGQFNWAWPVSSIQPFAPPFPVRGSQGFFDVDVSDDLLRGAA